MHQRHFESHARFVKHKLCVLGGVCVCSVMCMHGTRDKGTAPAECGQTYDKNERQYIPILAKIDCVEDHPRHNRSSTGTPRKLSSVAAYVVRRLLHLVEVVVHVMSRLLPVQQLAYSCHKCAETFNSILLLDF